MSAAAVKEFLTLGEFAQRVGKVYGTVRLWAEKGLVKAERKESNGRTYYRVPVQEAERVKERIDRGLWV